jgi:hypothetical protein
MRTLRTCSYRRFRVEGRLPSPASDEFSRRLRDRCFRPIGPGEERAYGWVAADNLLVTDFDAAALVRGERAVFALRIDRRRVDAKLLRAHLDLAVRAHLAASRDAGQPARIAREERVRMRREIQEDLLRQASPSVAAHTVVLDLRTRTLTFLCLARPAADVLRALFQDTFDAQLVPLTPWRRAGEALAGPRAASLDGLARTDFWRGVAVPTLAETRR